MLEAASCGSGRLRAAQGGFVRLREASCGSRRPTELRETETQYLSEVRPAEVSWEEPGHSAPGRGSDFLHRRGSQLCLHDRYKGNLIQLLEL